MIEKVGKCRYCGKEFKQPIYDIIEGPYRTQGKRVGSLVYCSDDVIS